MDLASSASETSETRIFLEESSGSLCDVEDREVLIKCLVSFAVYGGHVSDYLVEMASQTALSTSIRDET